MARDTPQATAQNLAVAGLDVLGLDEPEKPAVGPSLECVFLQVGTARDTPPEQKQRSCSDEPDIRPCRRESGSRVDGHAPQREDEQPPVDHEPAPEQLEAETLMDQIVGIKLDALKDKVVQYVECKERRIQENAWIGVLAKEFVVVRGPGQGVQCQHRPADDIEIHLYVEAVVEERQLLGPPIPQRQERIFYLALRLAEHRYDCKDGGEDCSTGHSIDRRPVEPVTRHPGEFESPHDQRDCKHQNAVEPIVAGFIGLRVDDVPGNPLSR